MTFFLFIFTSLVYTSSLHENFVSPKWLLLYILTGVAFTFNFLKQGFVYPDLKGPMRVLTCGLTLSLFVLMLQSWPHYIKPLLLEALFSVLLFLFFYQYLQTDGVSKVRRLVKFFVGINSLVLLISLTLIVSKTGMSLPLPSSTYPFFGNANMTAQYWGINFLFLLFYYVEKIEESKKSKLVLSYLMVNGAYLLMLQCRSVLLSLSLILMFLGISLYKKHKKMIGFIAIFVLGVFVIGFITNKNHSFLKGSLSDRLQIWRISLEMIKERPIFGWGSHSFEFYYMDFIDKTSAKISDYVIYDNPHNDFLKIIIEKGILFSIFLFVWIGYSIKAYLVSKEIPSIEKKFALSFILFVGIEKLFQFPSLISYTSFYLILFLSHISVKNLRPLKLNKPLVLFPLMILLSVYGYLVFSKGYSDYFVYNFTRYSQIQNACDLLPTNWIACKMQSSVANSSEELKTAEKSLKRILDNSKSYYPVIGELSLLYVKTGEIDKACEMVSHYKVQSDHGIHRKNNKTLLEIKKDICFIEN